MADMIGKRPTMEDAICVIGALGGDQHVDLIALFDGHGGSDVARTAAVVYPTLLEELMVNNR